MRSYILHQPPVDGYRTFPVNGIHRMDLLYLRTEDLGSVYGSAEAIGV